MTPLVVGADLSSRTLAFVDEERSTKFEVPKKMRERGEILRTLFLMSIEHLHYNGDFYIYVEDPVVGRGGSRATILQSQVQGIVLSVAVQSGALGVYGVNNKSWKKVVVGNGNASKDEVAQWLEEHEPDLAERAGSDQDLVDASCIHLYGKIMLERSGQISAMGLHPES